MKLGLCIFSVGFEGSEGVIHADFQVSHVLVNAEDGVFLMEQLLGEFLLSDFEVVLSFP